MKSLNVVALSGHLTIPSRTMVLAERLTQQVSAQCGATGTVIDLLSLCPALGATFERGKAGQSVEAALTQVESCDVLIAVTPVYKGAYSGLFKHFMDLVDMKSLASRPTIIAATGYSDRHAAVLDYHMRPLFSFFGAQVMPAGVFAGKGDMDAQLNLSAELQATIDAAVQQVTHAISFDIKKLV